MVLPSIRYEYSEGEIYIYVSIRLYTDKSRQLGSGIWILIPVYWLWVYPFGLTLVCMFEGAMHYIAGQQQKFLNQYLIKSKMVS